ncbi:MAG TPA: HAMP domain-containing sensor histidine kinase [Thermoanaerobaculia bacterium]
MQTTRSSSQTDSPPDGLAFVCTTSGEVTRVVRSTLGGATVARSLCAEVDAPSANACRFFLRGATSSGFARSTPLRLGMRDVHCFGLCSNDVVCVVAVVDPGLAAAFAEDVGNDEEPFRALAAEIRRTHSTYELYAELARVNNELVTAQRELARTVAELQRLNGFKDELLGMAAHDLRNPLHANNAFITFLLQDSGQLSDDNLVLLERMRTNGAYMLRLVEDTLDFAAIQSGRVRLRVEETAIDRVVTSVLETMRIVAERKHVAIRASIADDLPRLRLDALKLSQAVQNLVANAVQYSSEGAAVDVRVFRDDAGITIEVEDRGPGIPPEELPNLFKAFTRLSTSTSQRERSVGLGLAITRRLVEAHGGTIDVTSKVGKGSLFRIRLRAPSE